MLNTRNLRVAIAAFLLFSVVGYFAFSAGSFSAPADRVRTPVTSENAIKQGSVLKSSGDNKAPYDPSAGKPPVPEADDSEEIVNPSPVKAPRPSGYATGKFTDSKNGDTKDAAKPAAKEPVKDAAKAAATKAPVKAGALKDAALGACDKTDYVVMIDAGSTGSRVHVYEFNTCVSPPALLSEKFEMLKPGLSSFDTDTAGAAASLDPLLEVALSAVPKNKQACTPVAVKATAGLRLLGKEKSDAILAEVRKHLETDYPFAVVDGNGISIMDGKDEGVYAWITTNYLLGNIGTKDKLPTAAVFDLGGGSTQIVFEPELGDSEKMVEGEHQYEFTFGDRTFTLYQFSHLGYGLMEGRNKVNSLVLSSALKEGTVLTKYETKAAVKDKKADVTVKNPCLPPGVVAEDVAVQVAEGEFYVVNFKGPSEASGAQCRFLAEKSLNMDADCAQKPCSFNGVYQPSLLKAFHKNSDMWVFSYFYDRTNPLSIPSSFTVEELRDLTKAVCAGETLWKDVFMGESIKELQSEPQWCLDLSFITAMLHTGYNIPLYRELKTAKTIANNELGWCLGASLPLLNPKDGKWKCRVKETSV